MKSTVCSLFAASAIFALGCSTDRDLETYSEDIEYFDDGDFYSYSNIDADSGHLEGDIGTLRNLDDPADVGGYDDGDYTTLEILTQNENGSAMHLLDIYGGLGHPALQPGTTLRFGGGQYPSDTNAIHVEAMACSGDAPYDWAYDEPADEVELQVFETEDPDVMRIDYKVTVADHSTFGLAEPDVSTGTFEVRR